MSYVAAVNGSSGEGQFRPRFEGGGTEPHNAGTGTLSQGNNFDGEVATADIRPADRDIKNRALRFHCSHRKVSKTNALTTSCRSLGIIWLISNELTGPRVV